MTVAAVIAVIAGVSLGLTLIVLLVRGIFHLGKLVNRVEHLETRFDTLEGRFDNLETKFDTLDAKTEARIDALDAKTEARIDALDAKTEARIDALDAKTEAKIDALDAKFDARFDAMVTAINELRADVQQTNKILVGLANHTHDADGRTVFTIPQGD